MLAYFSLTFVKLFITRQNFTKIPTFSIQFIIIVIFIKNILIHLLWMKMKNFYRIEKNTRKRQITCVVNNQKPKLTKDRKIEKKKK